jgi:hypothetical protein
MTPRPPETVGSPLAAAARLAQDGRLPVRVLVPDWSADLRFLAEVVADQAGVDCAVEAQPGWATVHFIARHQDRRVRTTPAPRARPDQKLATPPRRTVRCTGTHQS